MRRIAFALFAALSLLFGLSVSTSAQDVDCDEISYEEAQQILAQDANDPNDLDRDNDGEACDSNAPGGGGTNSGGDTGTVGEDGSASGDSGNGATELPNTGTGTALTTGSSAALFGVMAVVALIVGGIARRSPSFRL